MHSRTQTQHRTRGKFYNLGVVKRGFLLLVFNHQDRFQILGFVHLIAVKTADVIDTVAAG
jgi:hypothetical protein